MYADHGSARPAFTQGHHRWPEYLQKRLWGFAPLQELIWLCGTCHDNLHGWLYMLMGEWSLFVAEADVPPRARREAEDVRTWYVESSAA